MRLSTIAILSAVALISACSDRNNDLIVQQTVDRAAIEEVIVRYVKALDTRDEALYLSVFTEDAIYDIEGDIINGHAELRAIITGLIESRANVIAAGRPPVDLYHPILNSSIKLISEDKATHEAYWQTLRKTDENIMRIGGMGRIDDELVKVNGEWKINKRVLSNFIQRQW